MQKCISITDEDLFLLREYRNRKGLKTDSQAIASLIRQERENLVSRIAAEVWNEFEKKYGQSGSEGE